MPKIRIIDPANYEGWDDLLLTNEKTTVFHTSGWCQVLAESYGYKPLYFTQIENDKLTGLLATMEVNSFLTGKRGVSLPFTDRCEPIAENRDAFEALLRKAVAYGPKADWKTLEIRGGQGYLAPKTSSATFLTHDFDLNKPEDELLSSFRSSTKRNIKKARKQGVRVEKYHTLDSVDAFYRLNCMTRRDHGLPPQPHQFFKSLYTRIISKKKGRVLLASHLGKIIAGAVFLHNRGRAVYKYGASDKKYQYLRANNRIMWEAIKGYAEDGLKSFNFGRTELDHAGLLQFKRGWGPSETELRYYRYDFAQNDFISPPSKLKSSYRFFQSMPVPVLKLIGRILYRHVA